MAKDRLIINTEQSEDGGGGGIGEAPIDNTPYVRRNGVWVRASATFAGATPTLIDNGGGATYSFSTNISQRLSSPLLIRDIYEIFILGINSSGTPSGDFRINLSPATSSASGSQEVIISQFSGSNLSNLGLLRAEWIANSHIEFYYMDNPTVKVSAVTFTSGRIKLRIST